MKPSQAMRRKLTRLAKQLHERGITHQRVADEASKTSRRGTVGVTTVSKVLAARTKSANVVATASRLVAECEGQTQNGRPAVETSRTA